MLKNKQMKNYSSIVKEKALAYFDYQGKFLGNSDFYEPGKPLVLAFGTGGGKTFTTIMKLDIYYSNPVNKGKKTVIFPHATNVLRNNFAESLEKYGKCSFSYCVIEDSSQIEDVFNSDCEVIIVLPQTVRKHLTKLSKVTWMIVDEAHEWYFAPMYAKIKAALRPDYQLLMTGTPSVFNNRPDDFLYYHVSVDELRKAGKAGNARIEIVSSAYTIEGQDVITSQSKHKAGGIVSRITDKVANTTKSLELVCNQMLKTLTNPTDVRVEPVNNLFGTVFNKLDKTIIFSNSQAQAKQFYRTLNKTLKGKILISVSADGGNSEEFAEFKNNDDIKVLVLVRKGRLGFDMPNLYNIVDFTLSTNVDVISQMLGRVLRPGDKQKYYFKVSPKNTVWFYQAIMMVVLRLTMQDAYEIYDGNQNKVRIPKSRKPRQRKERVDNPNRERTPNFSGIDTDIIFDLDFFRYVLHKGNKAFQTVSWCTLDDVRKECLNLRERRIGDNAITYEDCLQVVKERGYTKKIEFQYGATAHYAFIQTKGLMNKFVGDAGLKGRKLTLSYDEVKECADQCETRREFALKFQSKYKKAKQMGWLEEFFGEAKKSGPKVGHEGWNKKKNFTLNATLK
jgi:superfamily II DNA or RNA helicase